MFASVFPGTFCTLNGFFCAACCWWEVLGVGGGGSQFAMSVWRGGGNGGGGGGGVITARVFLLMTVKQAQQVPSDRSPTEHCLSGKPGE